MDTGKTLFFPQGMKAILDKIKTDVIFKRTINSLHSYFVDPPSLTCVRSEEDAGLFVEEALTRNPRVGLIIFVLSDPADNPDIVLLFNNGVTKKESI